MFVLGWKTVFVNRYSHDSRLKNIKKTMFKMVINLLKNPFDGAQYFYNRACYYQKERFYI